MSARNPRLSFLRDIVAAVPRTPLVGGLAFVRPRYASHTDAMQDDAANLVAAKGGQDEAGRVHAPLLFKGKRNANAAGALNGQQLIRASFMSYSNFGQPGANAGSTNAADLVNQLLYWDEKVCVVADAYPKSLFHFLVVPRDPALTDLTVVNTRHVPLIQHMRRMADQLVASIQNESKVDDEDVARSHWATQTIAAPPPRIAAPPKMPSLQATEIEVDSGSQPQTMGTPERELPLITRLRFMQGFHAIPSLAPLHMHVMSLDLCSPFLKKKSHYNSFTTGFFLTCARVEADLVQNGKVTLNTQTADLLKLEKRGLRCVWCDDPIPELPALRKHLSICKKNRSFLD